MQLRINITNKQKIRVAKRAFDCVVYYSEKSHFLKPEINKMPIKLSFISCEPVVYCSLFILVWRHSSFHSTNSLILFHVSSQASSRLYWREHAHMAIQLSTRYQRTSIKQESSEEKPTKKIDKYFPFSLLIMIEDSATLSLDLTKSFPEAGEI